MGLFSFLNPKKDKEKEKKQREYEARLRHMNRSVLVCQEIVVGYKPPRRDLAEQAELIDDRVPVKDVTWD